MKNQSPAMAWKYIAIKKHINYLFFGAEASSSQSRIHCPQVINISLFWGERTQALNCSKKGNPEIAKCKYKIKDLGEKKSTANSKRKL